MNGLIKKWRKEAKMTQEELAQKLFVTPQAISLIENGKRNIQYPLLEEVAKIFKKEIIFYIQDEPGIYEIKKGILESIIKPNILENFKNGLMAIDEQDIEKILFYGGKSYFAKSNGIILDEVIEGMFKHFGTYDKPLHKTKGLLLMVKGSSNFTFEDFQIISDRVHEKVDKDTNIMVGISIDMKQSRGYEVYLIASGL